MILKLAVIPEERDVRTPWLLRERHGGRILPGTPVEWKLIRNVLLDSEGRYTQCALEHTGKMTPQLRLLLTHLPQTGLLPEEPTGPDATPSMAETLIRISPEPVRDIALPLGIDIRRDDELPVYGDDSPGVALADVTDGEQVRITLSTDFDRWHDDNHERALEQAQNVWYEMRALIQEA